MKEAVTNFLQNIPLENRFQFINQLIFLNFYLNKTVLKLENYFHVDSTINKKHATTYVAKNIEIKENANFHNTYLLEQKMYDYVRRGETEKLKRFLLSAAKNQLLKEGILANNPLRQAKNIFLSGITKIGTLGAIRGGMDVEEAYQLMDLYSQECEKLTDVNSIRNLNLVALEDFCNRVHQSRLPKECSKEILIAMNFINNSTNKLIQVTDVAQHVHRSSSYLSKKFKQEVGVSVGKYIMHSKLEDAKHLLLYSEMDLSSISNYLCFSSQSYFQNVFKKNYGITPAKYRKNFSE
ncbi:helix-turn-helix domain-containing protein [Liquorilactobacillus ghanensis]